MKKTLVGTLLLASVVLLGCGKKAPVVAPSAQQLKVDAAVAAFQATAAAVLAGEHAYFAAGGSHLSASDQQQIDADFATLSKTVSTAVGSYDAAVSAKSQQDLVAAIKTGVQDLVTQLGHLSDAQMASFTAWLNTGVSAIDLALSIPQ